MGRKQKSTKVLKFALALAVAACLSPLVVSAQGKGGGGGPKPPLEVPVAISFRDAATDKVTSDNLGSYASGQLGVEALFSAGALRFFTSSDASARRRINISLDVPGGGGAVTCGPTEPCLWDPATHGTVMSVDEISLTIVEICGMDAADSLGFVDPNWGIGETRCGRMAYWFPDPLGRAFRWTERFRPAGWPLTNDVLVTKTSSNSWAVTVEQPAPGASSCPDLGDCTVLLRPKQSKGKTALFVEGYFRVPFLMTVVQLD